MSFQSEQLQPQWLKVSSTGKAHLLSVSAGGQHSWCGVRLTQAVPSALEERCKSCIEAVKAFTDEVLTPPPATTTTRYVLTVTRPATAEDPVAVITRKFAGRTTWRWSVEPYLPAPVLRATPTTEER